MSLDWWLWLGDLHRVLPEHWTGVVVTVAAVICGAMIGLERERAQKPVGLRTMTLICLGSAIFTQASILMSTGPTHDRTRIAAQIVSGIGFLGAGAIIRDRGMLIGVTTGAGIWATAAVGVVLGAGHVAAGAVFTLLIVATLSAAKAVNVWIGGRCRYQVLEVKFRDATGKARLRLQAILDEHQHEGSVEFDALPDGHGQARINYCEVHREHRGFVGPLLRMAEITDVSMTNANRQS